jgi:tetratricopeptide (TPR) repeat protein
MSGEDASQAAFNRIMENILGGLNGDTDHDLHYIKEQMDVYKDHEYGKEIIRALGRMLYERMPNDAKAEFRKLIADHTDSYNGTLEEVRFNQSRGDFEKAITIIEPLVEQCDDLSTSMYQDDAVTSYFCFERPAEEITYVVHNGAEKEVRISPEPFALVFFAYASLLFDLCDHLKAIEYLEKSLKWNPASAMTYFEISENYKQLGEVEVFHEFTLRAYPYVISGRALARYHRNNGFYYVEKGKLKLASACLLVSLFFEQSQAVAAELFYIKQQFGEDYMGMGQEEAVKLLEENGLPIGADPMTLSGLMYLLTLAAGNEGEEMLAATLKDLYDLTGDQQFYDRLVGLSEGVPTELDEEVEVGI